ncbi:MAG: beta-galactosidase trimerization domain-containing protein, partial [Chloroflexi bacterium]|nr:beta-galactosidase trimerization domain-containing protein [Chloroflexota bacterium]
PHPYFWPLSAQWVSLFRDGGLNRATQDDYWWQIGELGPEMAGYLDDVLRAGLDGKGVLQPYVMPHSPGNTDRDFNVGVATALLHGATALDFFNLGPEQTGTENYLSARDPKRYLTVREAAYALGAVEDLLLDGRRPPAQVGLVLSESSDRWERATPGESIGGQLPADAPSLVYEQERKLIWLALLHAHVPVDIVPESDLASADLSRYRVLYLVGEHLSADAARGLQQWVASGGTLVGEAGAGLLDAYGAPSIPMYLVYGLSESRVERVETYDRPRIELPRLKQIDLATVNLTARSVSLPLFGVRQRMTPMAGAAVSGVFADGSPAVVVHAFGRGRAVAIGGLVGTAYVHEAFGPGPPIPDRGPNTHTPLSGFSTDLREVLTGWASGLPQREARASSPEVEAGTFSTDRQVLLLLANHGPNAETVEVTVPDIGRVLDARRLGGQPVAVTQQSAPDAAVARLTLSVDDVAYVLITRQKG